MSKVTKKSSTVADTKVVDKVVEKVVTPVVVVEEPEQVVNQQVVQQVAQPVANVQKPVLDEKASVRLTQYNELLKKVDQSQEELSSLKSNLKKFYKLVEKDISKARKGRRRANRERSPTGFGKAGVIPEGLRTLLNLDENAEMTRPEVTKQLYAYLDVNDLRDAKDKRIMRVNPELVKAFGLTNEQANIINNCRETKSKNGLNFYNIQKFVAALYKGKPIDFELTLTDDTSSENGEEEPEQETEQEIEEVIQVKGRSKKAVK